MSVARTELAKRLELVRQVVDRTTEPLHVPLGLVFQPLPGRVHLEHWRAHAAACAAGTTYAPATLYVHVPFCARVCTFCLLSASHVPSKDVVSAYVDALLAQIDLYASVAEQLETLSLHVGGGTPTILAEADLDRLFASLARFPRAEGFRIGIEAHPATSTPGRLDVLARHGVHRLSLGVETLTPGVLRAVNREDQTEERVVAAVREARLRGLVVNLDLLAGLPGETEETFVETMRRALALEPDSLSVNRFLGENSELSLFGFAPNDEEHRRVDRMLLAADRCVRDRAPPRWPEQPLTRAGFGTQYVWERGDHARRYFQDDMIGPVSTLAFGAGALGHLYGQHFSIPAGRVETYIDAFRRAEPPEMLGAPVSVRFESAFYAAEHACRGELVPATYGRIFGHALDRTFGPELAFLEDEGLLTRRDERIAKPSRPDFQLVHLLAFLRWDARALETQLRALAAAAPAAANSEATLDVSGVGADEDELDALVAARATGAAPVHLDVGPGVSGGVATRLRSIGSARKLRLLVTGEPRRDMRQYQALSEELTPSMLWTRLAIRASQASRGEQRLAFPLPT